MDVFEEDVNHYYFIVYLFKVSVIDCILEHEEVYCKIKVEDNVIN